MEMNDDMKNRDKWITVVFLAFIMILPLVTVAGNMLPQKQESELSEAEKAVLEQNGTLTKDDGTQTGSTAGGDVKGPSGDSGFLRLQKGINTFTDGLFGRTKRIAFNTGLTSLLTGGTYIESTQTLMGKNNMFFYKTELDGKPIWDYMGINHFTEAEMAAIAANLTATRDHLNAVGIEFYTMCIPNKEIIYAENMPDTIARVNEVSRGEQLAEYLHKNTDLIFVYPKDALMANKDKIQLYYSTDSHSNQIGAFVNMQEFFRMAYGTHAEIDSVRFRTDATDYAGDLVTMAGLTDKYDIDTVYVFEQDSADRAQYHDQVLLYVGDSFGGFLSQICKGYYKEVYWEDARDFQYSMLDRYDPDVVIWERAERYCEVFSEPILIK